MSDKVNVTFNCPECGANPTELHFEEDTPDDDSLATCKHCGVGFGRYGDIKARAQSFVRDELQGQLNASLKKAGFKIK